MHKAEELNNYIGALALEMAKQREEIRHLKEEVEWWQRENTVLEAMIARQKPRDRIPRTTTGERIT